MIFNYLGLELRLLDKRPLRSQTKDHFAHRHWTIFNKLETLRSNANSLHIYFQ